MKPASISIWSAFFCQSPNKSHHCQVSLTCVQLFDKENYLNQHESDFVFTTEGHPIRVAKRWRVEPWEDEDHRPTPLKRFYHRGKRTSDHARERRMSNTTLSEVAAIFFAVLARCVAYFSFLFCSVLDCRCPGDTRYL